ncbi:DUF4124 domain-containing protein [Acinetobacter haemolyticus]|uniref:DUF4124 domain-containing protein n=1 Tax=Acinetobacter haemolyticus TaxID=29430 RepID=UPI000D694F90|nr:DUF4124 domain-containing protein [Acinetobacter haemolyticus]
MQPSHLKTITSIALTSLLVLCSGQIYAQQYYKWVDAKGSTHYTTTLPPKGAKRLDKVSTYGSNNNQNNPNSSTQNQQTPPQHTTTSNTNHPQQESTPIDETYQPQNIQIAEATVER